MNSNAIHNILNILIAVLAGATAFFLSTGCVTSVTGALDCSASWVPPAYLGWAVTGMGALKIIINVLRDGLGGLFKPQPPVQKD